MKTYNDKSRKPNKWTDKKLQAEHKRLSLATYPDTSAMRTLAMMGSEILRRRREKFG